MKIELTQGKVAIIDDADWDLVSGYKWFAKKSGNTYYAETKVRREGGGQRDIRMHRLLLSLTDQKIQVDHRDGNGLNNQRENLRACSLAENQRNRGAYANNKSGFKGVSWHKQSGKWRASIGVNGKRKHIGLFDTPEAAHASYCLAAVEFHGEFANHGQQPNTGERT